MRMVQNSGSLQLVSEPGCSRQNFTYRVNIFTESLSFEFQSLPLTQFLWILERSLGSEIHSCPHYSSSNSGVSHNSILNGIYNRSAVSPISEWFVKEQNSFIIGIDLPEISVSSVYDAIYLLLYLNFISWDRMSITLEFYNDLILEVTVDPTMVARDLYKIIYFLIRLNNHLIFRSNLFSNQNFLWLN